MYHEYYTQLLFLAYNATEPAVLHRKQSCTLYYSLHISSDVGVVQNVITYISLKSLLDLGET